MTAMMAANDDGAGVCRSVKNYQTVDPREILIPLFSWRF